ncbi:MAG TPA: adenylate/guanylate cyclase domain-containing protein [Hyphomicrobiales bacterium]|nr:adenylate/guanylate cyclase domain-containing protein [Hyphomicrobiales bacterium]
MKRLRGHVTTGPLPLVFSLRPWQARLLLLALAALVAVALTATLRQPLRVFEEQLGAWGWTLAPDTQREQRVNIVAIDEASLQQLGPWPWPRETLTRLADALGGYGVQLQLYDIVLPEAKPGDDALATALATHNGVLAQVPVLTDGQTIRTGALSHPLDGLACNAGAPQTAGFIGNAPVFANLPKGHIALRVDSDGAVRKIPAYVCVDGRAYPALALSAFIAATGATDWLATRLDGNAAMGPAATLRLDAYPDLQLPLDAAGNLRVSYRQTPDSFQAFSAVDVINGTLDRELLENTWVLVGHTAFGLVDIVPTPYAGAAPGVEVQARILTSLLDGNVPFEPKAAPLLQLALCLAFAVLLLAAASQRREKLGVISLALCALVLPLVALGIHIQVLRATNLWLGWIGPATYGALAAGLLVVHEFTRVRHERNRVLSNLSSYLPHDVAQEIAYSLPNSDIQARRQSVTLLSADLRNFSAYGEARLPEEAATLLHFFFVKATGIIEAHHGRIHEFKGDGLIALWDQADANAAHQALAAAQELQRDIQALLPAAAPPGLEPLALGIGIEQGPVLIGSIGPAQRRTHALLGETVTVVLRIQEMTAELAQPVLIGTRAAQQLQDQYLESQGGYLLDGLRTPHTLYAPPLPGSNRQPALKLHRGGLEKRG